MKFTIDRKTWLRGQGNSSLLKDGMSCCMGQIALQCGVNSQDIVNVPVLRRIAKESASKLLENFLKTPTWEASWVHEAYSINDSTQINDETRERFLRELAAKNGHELTFVN